MRTMVVYWERSKSLLCQHSKDIKSIEWIEDALLMLAIVMFPARKKREMVGTQAYAAGMISI